MSRTGWSDDRFMIAYDAIHGILADYATPNDKLPELRLLLSKIEQADTFLAGVFVEREQECEA